MSRAAGAIAVAGAVARGAILVVAMICVPAALTPARAQGLQQHDSTLPIEITADSLEVVQKDQIATFLGNVDAVQGDLVLSADELRVHYRASTAERGITTGSDGSIRRIEAMGNVFLSSPEETAQGDFGVYDVDGGFLTLEGAVVLTRDDNVVRGERLEIDLASGRSQVFAAVPSTAGGTPAQRVKAVFAPSPEPAAPAPAAPKPAAGPPEDAPAAPQTGPSASAPETVE